MSKRYWYVKVFLFMFCLIGSNTVNAQNWLNNLTGGDLSVDFGSGATATAASKTFVELVQELDGGYVSITNNTLHFKFLQEYASASLDIRYNIYNWQRQNVHSGIFAPSYGVNWISIPLSLPSDQYYILELEANKGEKYFIRFKN